MPRTIPAPLQARLDLAECSPIVLTKLTRSDGLVLRLTSWDRPVVHDGETWDPSDGIQLSAIQATAGGAADDVEAQGFLTDDRITEEDLLAGLWDDAEVEVLFTEAQALDYSAVLFAGRIGELAEADGRWKASLLSLSDRIRGSVVERTSAQCRCQRLGDARCGVILAANTVGGTAVRQTGTVSSSSGLALTISGLSAPDGHFTGGILKVTSGSNAGQERTIKSQAGSAIGLRRQFPFAVSAGATVELTAGCDRTFATCKSKFGNANSFQGEPDIPGNDAITRMGRT